jgi:hypothetical protein
LQRVEIRLQLADLESLQLTAQTVQGPLRFAAQGRLGDRELRLEVPAGCQAELVLPREEPVDLKEAPASRMLDSVVTCLEQNVECLCD